MRLARKLSLAMVAGIAVVLAFHGIFAVRRATRTFSADVREHELIVGHALEPALASAWKISGTESALEELEYANEHLRRARIRWVWLDAQPPARHVPRIPAARLASVRAGVDQSIETTDEGGRLYTYVPVVLEGQPAAALELSESLSAQKHFVRNTILDEVITMGATGLVAGLIVALLGAWLVGRPMRKLAEKARRIGGGDLSTPLEIGQRDEIGEVAAEMNAMCGRLAEAREAIAAEASARLATVEQLRHAERLSTVGKLAAGVAHELGTPLNVVSGRAKMIAADLASGEAHDSAVVIHEQADRMARIIRQLLDFARRTGRPKSPVDAAQLARQTLALVGPIAAKRGVALELAADVALVVEADAGQLSQALTNLVINGVQASAPGGKVQIALGELDVEGRGRHAFLEVRDDGVGIPPEDLARIFEPFFTTKGVGEGTGLGLSVAYGIVDDHGGWIDVQSEPGAGSRFRILLPASHKESEGPCAAAS